MVRIGTDAGVLTGIFAKLGGLLMALVADEDLRLRYVIARAASQSSLMTDVDFAQCCHAPHDLTIKPRVE